MTPKTLACITTLSVLGLLSSGCAICCGPDDYNYGTYGGLHERMDRRYGRVGSVFSDPGGTAMKLSPHLESPESYQSQPYEQDENDDNVDDPSDLPSPENLPRPGDTDQDQQGIDTVRGVRFRRNTRPMPPTNRVAPPQGPQVFPMNNQPPQLNQGTPIPARPINNQQSRSFLGGGRYR